LGIGKSPERENIFKKHNEVIEILKSKQSACSKFWELRTSNKWKDPTWRRPTLKTLEMEKVHLEKIQNIIKKT